MMLPEHKLGFAVWLKMLEFIGVRVSSGQNINHYLSAFINKKKKTDLIIL